MEGLIPMVCKVIKRGNGRRRYRCLSSGAVAQPHDRSDFNPNVILGDGPYGYMTPQYHVKERNGGPCQFKSYEGSPASLEEYEGKGKDDDGVSRGQHHSSKQKLVQFRSQQHRTFSCLTGGFSQ
ncbi:hypothetical protein BT93_L4048 [Corymbia citriodora subsp. variegata]|uniref:Uncharacterized protein n=1 Tax=Corymbia citriodora subsp. variegata TaxID=360336 RepID=A0A8T0CUT4_CORYI|nr:hypothetical protein BT93_L4048 [Corymbia citriodora subsp. variegata]